jgi:hypothetical protein
MAKGKYPLAIVAGVAVGLVGGLAATFPLWIGVANIWFLFGLNRFWGNDGLSMALFMSALYPIWLLVLWVIKRRMSPLDFLRTLIVVALAVIPLPSILVLFMWWQSCVGKHGGQC